MRGGKDGNYYFLAIKPSLCFLLLLVPWERFPATSKFYLLKNMPIYIAPGSDEDRLRFLEATELADAQDLAPGAGRISAATRAALPGLKGGFASAFSSLAMRLGGRIKEVTESQRADGKLSVYVRDFWEVLKRRTYRLEHNISVFAHYGLPSDGSVPVLSSRVDLVTAATKIGAGEPSAVGAGFPAMSNPSAAEVVVKFNTAQTERAEVGPADNLLDQAQTTIAALRAAIDELIEDIVADIRYKERKQDDASIRRILRRYGAKFEFTEGEVPDEVVTPPPPAPPTV